MDKNHLNLGLHSGPPLYTSEEAVLEQLRQSPKVLGPSLATRAVQQSKETQAVPTSESNPEG